MPPDLTRLRSEDLPDESALRTRLDHGHYDEHMARARLEAAVCEIVAPSIERDEVVAGVLSTTQRMVKR